MRPTNSNYDRNAASATMGLLDALKRGGYTVETICDGAVIVDGDRIEPQAWDDMAQQWDGTADGLEELGWEAAADAMRDDD